MYDESFALDDCYVAALARRRSSALRRFKTARSEIQVDPEIIVRRGRVHAGPDIASADGFEVRAVEP